MDATIMAALPNSPMFNAFCGSPPSFTETINVPMMETTMPAAAINRGSIIKLISNPPATRILEPKTMEPIIDPT